MLDVEQSQSEAQKPQCPYALKRSHTQILFNLAVWTVLSKTADEVSACSRKKNKKAKLVMLCVQQAKGRRRDAAFIFSNCVL